MKKIILTMDGNAFCATFEPFTNMMEMPAGFGKDILSAVDDLLNQCDPYACSAIIKEIKEDAPTDTQHPQVVICSDNICEYCSNGPGDDCNYLKNGGSCWEGEHFCGRKLTAC